MNVQCVQATLAPRRRRRPVAKDDSELLDRVKYYEGLLRKHNILFDPHKPSGSGKPLDDQPFDVGSPDGAPSESSTKGTDASQHKAK